MLTVREGPEPLITPTPSHLPGPAEQEAGGPCMQLGHLRAAWRLEGGSGGFPRSPAEESRVQQKLQGPREPPRSPGSKSQQETQSREGQSHDELQNTRLEEDPRFQASAPRRPGAGDHVARQWEPGQDSAVHPGILWGEAATVRSRSPGLQCTARSCLGNRNAGRPGSLALVVEGRHSCLPESDGGPRAPGTAARDPQTACRSQLS